MNIHIACDHAGFALKEILKEDLAKKGYFVLDHGAKNSKSTDYPIYANILCQALLADNEESRGILICGTGIGMSMVANRHKGIRAALCSLEFHARAARAHNDANVLCLGSRVLGEALTLELVSVFLATPFEGGRHLCRIEQFD